MHTANVAARGNCGRFTVNANTRFCVLEHWCKILYMEDYRLTKSCCKMIHNLDVNGRITWATKAKNLLYNLAFGPVWLSQEKLL